MGENGVLFPAFADDLQIHLHSFDEPYCIRNDLLGRVLVYRSLRGIIALFPLLSCMIEYLPVFEFDYPGLDEILVEGGLNA